MSQVATLPFGPFFCWIYLHKGPVCCNPSQLSKTFTRFGVGLIVAFNELAVRRSSLGLSDEKVIVAVGSRILFRLVEHSGASESFPSLGGSSSLNVKEK